MKKVFILQCFLVLWITGCATSGAKTNSYWEYPPAPILYKIEVRSVSVSIDRVKESIIAAQMTEMLDTQLKAGQQYDYPFTGVLYMDIDIVQRIYLDDIKQKNSLYINCVLTDEDGIIRGAENILLNGKESIISVRLQNESMQKLVKKILTVQSERYKLLQKLEQEKLEQEELEQEELEQEELGQEELGQEELGQEELEQEEVEQEELEQGKNAS